MGGLGVDPVPFRGRVHGGLGAGGNIVGLIVVTGTVILVVVFAGACATVTDAIPTVGFGVG